MKLTVRVLFVLVAIITIVTIIKSDASHANPPPQATIPGCEPFHSVSNANVRSCASLECNVVRSVSSSETLCIRGVADNTDWFQVDLEPQNASSALYYIHNSVVIPGVASSNATQCQGWLVQRGVVATIYQCASESCAALGTMSEYEWGCAQEYSGEYADWLYLQDSDIGVNGWVRKNLMRPGSTYTDPITVTPVFNRPPGSSGNNPVRTPGTPTVTPRPGTLTVAMLNNQLPACQNYHVSAQSARIHTCAGEGCPVQKTLTNEEMLCVRGIVPENPEWLVVDLEPSDPDTLLYAVHRDEVLPGSPEVYDEANLFDCEPWEVASTLQVRARSCPSTTCPIVTTLPTDTWVCVRDFGGQYSEWLYIDLPDAEVGERAWVSSSIMRPLLITGTPTDVPGQASSTPDQPATTPTRTLTPSATSAIGRTPIGTATESITLTPSPQPTSDTVCQNYVVAVVQANVRSAPSTNSDTVTTLNRNTAVCVVGPAPNLEGLWKMVDLDPNNPNDEFVFMSDTVLTLSDDGFTVTPNPLTPSSQSDNSGTPSSTTGTPGTPNSPTPIITSQPTVGPSGNVLAQELTLASLGVRNVTLFSPIGASTFRFGIPANWFPDGNNILWLRVEYFETIPPFDPSTGPTQLTSTFDIQLDDRIIASVSLDNTTLGEQDIAIPLPIDILADTERRSHNIQMTFRGEDFCLANSQSRLLIREDLSFFHFEFREGLTSLDLALYPRPLYNEALVNVVETTFVVIPDEPTTEDLQAVASVVAGLGQLSFNSLNIRVVTAGSISDVDYRDNNLLLIGQVGTNSKIDALYANDNLPSILNDDGVLEVNNQLIDLNDGVVQVIEHPDNPKRGIVVATGQTPEALRKASIALAGPPPLLGLGGAIALVSDINQFFRPFTGVINNPDVTFSELGFPEIFLTGIGTLQSDVDFTIPFDQVLADGAYVDLSFTASELIANGQSTVTLLLNGQTPLSSTFIRPPENPDLLEPFHIRALIPPESVLPGEVNTITIQVTVKGEWNCNLPNPDVIWMRISGESALHLPTQIINQSALQPLVGWFPLPFDNQPNLSDVLISLPSEPTPADLEQAYRLIARLAANTRNGEGFRPLINLGELPESGLDLSQYHVIIIGRPTTNPILATINETLPQPFLEAEDGTITDILAQKLDNVIYRLPDEFEVGVIEAFQSPWGSEGNQRVVLVLTGTGPSGQANAVATLAEERYSRTDLFGNIVYVTANSISVVDTRLLEFDDELPTILSTDLPREIQTQNAIAAAASPTHDTANTVTPGPTPTQTVALVTTTPIISPTPTIASPTPAPTIPATSEEDLQPASIEAPGWLNILAIITTGILILAGVFAGFRLLRQDQRR
jgi:uncharacterized protein YgiM (DUF1202 family)